MEAELAAANSFWSADRPHEGDPSTWSLEMLRAWLEADAAGFSSGLGWKWNFQLAASAASARGQQQQQQQPAATQHSKHLVEQTVVQRLDALFASFQPSYPADLDGVSIPNLPTWQPQQFAGAGKSPPMPFIRVAGPLERCFNSSMGIHETMAHLGKPVPMGLHPLDDFRSNCLVIARAFDEGRGSCIIMQDVDQEEACMLSVRGVRLLLPGGRPRPGSRVVLLRPLEAAAAAAGRRAAEAEQLHGLVGSQGEVEDWPEEGHAVVSFARQAPAADQQQQADADAQAPQAACSRCSVRVALHRLMLLQQQPSRSRSRHAGSGAGQPPEGARDPTAPSDPAAAASSSTASGQQQQRLVPGAWVVLHSLGKEELNGRLGTIAAAPEAGGGADPDPTARYQVLLVDWSSGAACAPAPPPAPPSSVRVKLHNMVAVVQPAPAVLVAYSGHTARDLDVDAFMRSIGRTLGNVPTQSIRCSMREMRMFKRALAGSTVALSAAQRLQLMGSMERKWWEMAVLAPTLPPAAPEDLARRELRARQACRVCAAAGTKLMLCNGCKAVSYCSRACQVADWKDRHKAECKAMSSASAEATAGGADSESSLAASGGQAGAGSAAAAAAGGHKAVLVDIRHSDDDNGDGLTLSLDMGSGRVTADGALPGNLHGDSPFIVKVQNQIPGGALGGLLGLFGQGAGGDDGFQQPLFVYDEPKSLSFRVGRVKCPAQHAALVAALKSHGRPGAVNPAGRKVYLFATRVGDALHIVVEGQVPPQQQRW